MHLNPACLALAACILCIVSADTGTQRRPDHGHPLGKPVWNATWTDTLKRALMVSYDKFARPSQHSNTTTVSIDVNLKHIVLNEMTQVMTVYAWVKMYWVDEKLKWNASDYGGLSRLHLADHEIWQPDIVLYNSASGSEVDHYGNTHCIVHEDGSVLWVPPAHFNVFCDLNLRHWPYDEQTCTLRLGSWTYDGDQVDLQVDDGESEADLMVNNSEWELVETVKQRNVAFYSCCVEAYIDVTYTLTLRRRSPSYGSVVITPVVVVVLLTLAAFWLPPHAGEKVVLNAFTALIICLMLLSFSQKLPAMASHTPLILLFYSSSLVLITLALLEAVLVLNLARTPRSTQLPWPVKRALTGWLGRTLCLGATSAPVHTSLGSAGEELREHGTDDTHGMADDRQMITGRSQSAVHHDWILLAVAIDRLAFCLYCFMFAILSIAYV